MFLLELIYFLAAPKKKIFFLEVTWKCWADFSPCDSPGGYAGERQEVHGAQDSPRQFAFGLQTVKGKYQLEPTLRCRVPLLHNKEKNTSTIAHHVAFGGDELPIYNLLCLDRTWHLASPKKRGAFPWVGEIFCSDFLCFLFPRGISVFFWYFWTNGGTWGSVLCVSALLCLGCRSEIFVWVFP